MPTFSPTEVALQETLHQRLHTAGCVRGRFDISDPGAQLSLSGQKPDGKTIFFWEFDRPFKRLAGQYLEESHDQNTAQLTMQLDVATGEVQHTRTTRQQLAARQAADEKRALAQRRQAPRDRTPYGPALAEQVAARLDQGAILAYSHRDYCGEGLSRLSSGQYAYGEVWDGALRPHRFFSDRAALVAWLAAQSDYALSGVGNADPWSWDNQPITRQRLLEFVR